MPSSTHESITPQVVVSLLRTHRKLWVYPAVGVALLALVVTLVTPRQWQATQGLMIRPEVAGITSDRLGKFSDLSEMKTLQETIFELARSQAVVTAVLREVGPGRGTSTGEYPTPEDIATFRDNMVMTPPGGAEFGTTEVFYLAVRDRSPGRAARLVASLSSELEKRSNALRDERARSMIAELSEGVDQAEGALARQTEKLAAFESQIGARLSDLRGLENPIGGTTTASQDILAIQSEIRANDGERRRNEKLLEVLTQADRDPATLLATPSSLLASQPALERLKQGLVDAQLTTARLLGKLAPQHPSVQAAMEAERQVRKQLRGELATATQGVQMELDLSRTRDEALREQLAENQASLSQLASHRATYSNLVAAVTNQTALVEAARARLADAQGHLAGATASSLLSRIDQVEAGTRPLGPGRASIVGAGGLLGLLGGLGLVFLLHGPAPITPGQLDAAEPRDQSVAPQADAPHPVAPPAPRATRNVAPRSTPPTVAQALAGWEACNGIPTVTH